MTNDNSQNPKPWIYLYPGDMLPPETYPTSIIEMEYSAHWAERRKLNMPKKSPGVEKFYEKWRLKKEANLATTDFNKVRTRHVVFSLVEDPTPNLLKLEQMGLTYKHLYDNEYKVELSKNQQIQVKKLPHVLCIYKPLT